jgi:hypothetical protein
MAVAKKAGNLIAPMIIQWLEPPLSRVTLKLFTLCMHKLAMKTIKHHLCAPVYCQSLTDIGILNGTTDSIILVLINADCVSLTHPPQHHWQQH